MAGIKPYDTTIPISGSRIAPINTSVGDPAKKVLGVKNLPAVREPIFSKSQDCAMTGPIFRYDGKAKGFGGLPPQFNRKWIISDCKDVPEFYFRLLTLDSLGEKVLDNTSIFEDFKPNTLVDMKQGLDGAIYFVSWAFGIYKITYSGTCADPALVPETTGSTDPAFANYNPAIPKAFSDPRLCVNSTALHEQALDSKQFFATATSFSINVSGRHTLDLLDIRGRCIWSKSGKGAQTYAIPSSVPPGIYHARVHAASGRGSRLLYKLGVNE